MKTIKERIEGIAFDPAHKTDREGTGTTAEKALEDALDHADIDYVKDESDKGEPRFLVENLYIRVGDEEIGGILHGAGAFHIDAETLVAMAKRNDVLDLSEEEVLKDMKGVLRRIGEYVV